MTTFRDAFPKFGPSWLTTGDGEKVLYTLGLVDDATVERARQAAMARFPEYAPEDALPYMSRDRKILRGIDETAEAFASRLVPWLDAHKKRGNPFELCRQLRAYCNADVRVRTVDRRGNWFTVDRDGTLSMDLRAANWDWDSIAASPRWARFWVIIYPTSEGEPWTEDNHWGTGEWGDGRTWGTTATPGQVAAVRAIVRDWRPAGTRCESIIIAFDDDSFDPTAPEPDGSWDHWGTGSPYAKNRLATARYWKGTGA